MYDLLSKGVLLEPQKKDGCTSLHVAVNYSKLVLKGMADIHAKTQDGRSVVDITRQKNHQYLVEFLEKCLKKELDKMLILIS